MIHAKPKQRAQVPTVNSLAKPKDPLEWRLSKKRSNVSRPTAAKLYAKGVSINEEATATN